MAKNVNNRIKTEPTYKDFLNQAEKAGVGDTFSKKDIEVIKNNPALGIDMVQYKQNYNNASSEEEKEFWEEKAQSERLANGYYNEVVGDGNGGYKAVSHTADDDGTKQSVASRMALETIGTIKKYDDSIRKDNKWLDMIDSMFEDFLNKKEKSLSKDDILYKLAIEYAERAMENQMAKSASLTGGYGNSFASAAGQTVYSDYVKEALELLAKKKTKK